MNRWFQEQPESPKRILADTMRTIVRPNPLTPLIVAGPFEAKGPHK